jgi:hypothetical protein
MPTQILSLGQKSIAAVPLMAGREEEPGAGRCKEAAPAGGGQDGGAEEDPRHEARGGSTYTVLALSSFSISVFCYIS